MNLPDTTSRVSAAGASGPTIRVHIERLVVNGLAVRDRDALGAAVQTELTRLFADQGWGNAPAASLEAKRVDGGTLRSSARPRENDLGRQIGAAVHGGLTR